MKKNQEETKMKKNKEEPSRNEKEEEKQIKNSFLKEIETV